MSIQGHIDAIAELPVETRLVVLDALRVRAMTEVETALRGDCTNAEINMDFMARAIRAETIVRSFNDAGGEPLYDVDRSWFSVEYY